MPASVVCSLQEEQRSTRPVAESCRDAALARLAKRLEAVYDLQPTVPVLSTRDLHLLHPLSAYQEELLKECDGSADARLTLMAAARWLVQAVRCVLFGMYVGFWMARLRWSHR